jgi:hypothetical protein
VMRDTVAKLLLNLATCLGCGSGDRRLKIEDKNGSEDRGLKIEDRNVVREMGASPSSALYPQPSLAWDAGDARGLGSFLDSNHGQAFSARLRTVAAHVAIEGAKDRANTIHSAGVSAGWNECVRYIHSLSRVSGERQGAAAHLVDEQGPEDEAELLERLSP